MPVRIVTSVSPKSNPFDDIDDLDGAAIEALHERALARLQSPAPVLSVIERNPGKAPDPTRPGKVLGGIYGLSAKGRWGDHGPDLYQTTHLDDLLTTIYDDDAHFVACVVVDASGAPLLRQPRLQMEGLSAVRRAGLDVRITALVCDIDNPKHVTWEPETLSRAWPLVRRIETAAIYSSRAGFRVIQPLTRWLSPEEHRQIIRPWLAQMDKATGLKALKIDVDMKCVDWTRNFRAPYVVRGGVPQQPHIHPKWSPVDPPVPPPAPPPRPMREIDAIFAALPRRHQTTRPASDISNGRRYAAKVTLPSCGSGECEETAYSLARGLVNTVKLDQEAATAVLTEWAAPSRHDWGKGGLARKVAHVIARKGGA